jgi:glyoxylase-like metal-dependent hydrolase (beta-lactamase superfamily II)
VADKITVGNVEIMAVMDMVPPSRPPEAMFPEIPREAWGPYEDILENGQFQLYYCCFVVRSKGITIMVDTGMGPGPHVERGNLTGNLDQEIRPLLLPPDQVGNASASAFDEVNIVAHSHLHADHVGWNMRYGGGAPTPYFPKARYLVPRLDWEHFTKPEVLKTAPYVENQVVPLQGLGKMDIIDGEHSITDEITTLHSPGHTPGHLVILIHSQGEKAMVMGDVLHSKAQVNEPGWTAGVDIDKEASRRSRSAMLDLAEREGYVVAAGHFHPVDHIGKVVRLEGRRYWQAL